MTDVDKDKAVQLKTKGNQAFSQKDYSTAIKYYTQAIHHNSQDHTLYSNRSTCYSHQGQYQLSLQDAQKCITLNPSWWKGYKRKGFALFKLNKIQQAIESYKEGLNVQPNCKQLQQDLKSIMNIKGKDQFSQEGFPQNNQFIAQMLVKLQNNPKTKHLMQKPGFLQKLQMAFSNPANLPAFMNDPQIAAVMEVLTEGIDLSKFGNMGGQDIHHEKPKSQPTSKQSPPYSKSKQEKILTQAEEMKEKGNECYKRKDFHDAIEWYKKAIQKDSQQVLFYGNLAAAYIELEDFQNADDKINEAIKLIEDGKCKDYIKKAKIYGRKGGLMKKMKRYDQAINWYEKSLLEDHQQKIKQELKEAHKLKQLQMQKEYINPQIGVKHNEQAKKFFQQGKYPEAIQQYNEAIRRDPECAKYYFNRGLTYIKLMEFVRAKNDMDSCLCYDKSYIKAYAKKGDCHFLLKEYHKALEVYQAGLALDKDYQPCIQGIQKTQMKIITGSDKSQQEERARHAMADPDIQSILRDPQIQTILNQIQQGNTQAVMNAMKIPHLQTKISKLIASGILKTG